MCPVCTVAVGAGLWLSRILGIDDLVTSVWIGGFILSFSFWITDWISKKWKKLKYSQVLYPVIALFYLFVFVPLKWNGAIGIAGNSLGGVDKIILGTAIGSIAFLVGIWADKKEREIEGKQLFQFQKVVFPLLGLIIPTAALAIWL